MFRSGSINSISPASGASVKKAADRENLKRTCQVTQKLLIHEKKAESSFQAIKGVDSKLVEMILNEVIPRGSTGVTWADVSGQTFY